jgi:hypothetical protein
LAWLERQRLTTAQLIDALSLGDVGKSAFQVAHDGAVDVGVREIRIEIDRQIKIDECKRKISARDRPGCLAVGSIGRSSSRHWELPQWWLCPRRRPALPFLWPRRELPPCWRPRCRQACGVGLPLRLDRAVVPASQWSRPMRVKTSLARAQDRWRPGGKFAQQECADRHPRDHSTCEDVWQEAAELGRQDVAL